MSIRESTDIKYKQSIFDLHVSENLQKKKKSAAFNEVTCPLQYSINLNYFRDSDNAINLEKMGWIKQRHTGHAFKEVNQRNLNKYVIINMTINSNVLLLFSLSVSLIW